MSVVLFYPDHLAWWWWSIFSHFSKSTEEPNKPDDLPTEEEIDKRLTNLFDADDLLLNENLVGAGRENDFNDLIQSLNQEGKASSELV